MDQRKDEKPRPAGIVAAFIFGSVAIGRTGDGHDVDTILELSDEQLGFQFLQSIHDYAQGLFPDPSIPDHTTPEEYHHLAAHRITLAISLLGLQTQVNSPEFTNIMWGGRYQEWDSLCRQNQWVQASRVEEQSRRPPDLFLIPPNWQDNDRVRELLPNWSSDRPWAKRNFFDIMVLQSRRFNPATGHFGPRRKGSAQEERLLRRALRQEAKIAR